MKPFSKVKLLWDGNPFYEKCFENGFRKKMSFQENLGMGLPCPCDVLKENIFEKRFAGSKKEEKNVFEKLWSLYLVF